MAGGATIKTGTLVIEAQWFLSTSDEQGRKSYKLLDGIVHVPVASMVWETGLGWMREGRGSGEYILEPESHLALMSHNYNDVRK